MSFSRIISAIRNDRSRSVTMSCGNSAGPCGQALEDLRRRGASRFSPVFAEIGIKRGERQAAELVERRQQLDLARERVDLVQHEERAVELVLEHVDQRAVLAHEPLGLDDEQRDVAVLERPDGSAAP